MSSEKEFDPQACEDLIDKKDKHLDGNKTREGDQKEQGKKSTLKTCVNILAGVTILLLVALLGVTITWYVLRVNGLKPREHETCLPCDELKGRYDHADVLNEFRRQEKDECCGKTSRILKRLVAKATTEKYSSDLANNFFASSSEKCEETIPEKPAAKVAGISFMEMKQDADRGNMVHWNKSSAHSFFKQNVDYTDGGLHVKQAGFYYIFNQMKWFLNNSDTFPIQHEIVLQARTDGTNKVLLEGRKSRCNLVEESGETTSSIGAVFELQKSDKIFVTTSRPEDLAPCHHGNFFGLYQVAEAAKDIHK